MRTRGGRRRSGIGLGLVALLALVAGAARAERHEAAAKPGAKPDVEITVVGVEYEGTKLWVPATIVAHKGDRVKVTLINNIPSEPPQHGWAVDAFKVAAVVDRGASKTVELVADKAGVFPIYCQLHPAHVGGQLLVLDPGR
jgi:nitrosocyanin